MKMKDKKMHIPIFKISELIDDWFDRQVEYNEIAANAEKQQHEIKFNGIISKIFKTWNVKNTKK